MQASPTQAAGAVFEQPYRHGEAYVTVMNSRPADPFPTGFRNPRERQRELPSLQCFSSYKKPNLAIGKYELWKWGETD